MIVAIETSAELCSVAMIDPTHEIVLSEGTFFVGKQHLRVLPKLVENTLAACDLTINDISAFALAGGPGSYTGLRIGTSFVKGCCLVRGVPLISVPSLEVWAGNVMPQAHADQANIWVLMDARRMEVYAARYTNTGVCLSEAQPIIFTSDFVPSFQEYTWVVGDGVKKVEPILSAFSHLKLMPDLPMLASGMLNSVVRRYNQAQFEDLVTFEPTYLKPVHLTIPKKLGI